MEKEILDVLINTKYWIDHSNEDCATSPSYECEISVALPTERNNLHPLFQNPKIRLFLSSLTPDWGTVVKIEGKTFRINTTKVEANSLEELKNFIRSKIINIVLLLKKVKEKNEEQNNTESIVSIFPTIVEFIPIKTIHTNEMMVKM